MSCMYTHSMSHNVMLELILFHNVETGIALTSVWQAVSTAWDKWRRALTTMKSLSRDDWDDMILFFQLHHFLIGRVQKQN